VYALSDFSFEQLNKPAPLYIAKAPAAASQAK
jgi:hypothetical protein